MDLFIGIDVSKATLDVAGCTADGPLAELCSTIANTEAGLATLVPRLVARAPALVVLEATGGYERLAAATLAVAGLAVVVITPRQVREFAKAVGQLAKTDRPAAALLARFAALIRPPVREQRT